MPADWTELLADASGLTDVYSTAPALERCKLHYLHFDERGTSATLGLSTGDLPDRPHPEWEAKPFNSLTFYLVCEEITKVALNGWELPAPTLELTPAAAGVSVVAENEGSSLHLTAESVRVEGVRTTLVSETAI
ncbi:Imm50 family immunity protein [Streptomyces marispadix]|uniref:Immunity 50 family protein n=1 Tax=Streptomyces marispadix TaxID=2922868 RepID=A0ABS9SUI2_9ACTN|nr:Imm50 family immunity protein [Streptomyces marispadix]MCH6159950.1 immunity 50 family protein [Streptomyces marispadix]